MLVFEHYVFYLPYAWSLAASFGLITKGKDGYGLLEQNPSKTRHVCWLLRCPRLNLTQYDLLAAFGVPCLNMQHEKPVGQPALTVVKCIDYFETNLTVST